MELLFKSSMYSMVKNPIAVGIFETSLLFEMRSSIRAEMYRMDDGIDEVREFELRYRIWSELSLPMMEGMGPYMAFTFRVRYASSVK